MSCGHTPSTAYHSPLSAPLQNSPHPLDATTPHTVAADFVTPHKARRGPHAKRRLPEPLTVSKTVTSTTTTTTRGQGSAPAPLSPTHRALLDVIQQQQERIAALQMSLLHATHINQRTSRAFSLEPPLSTATGDDDASHVLSSSSLPLSFMRAGEDADDAAPWTDTPAALMAALERGEGSPYSPISVRTPHGTTAANVSLFSTVVSLAPSSARSVVHVDAGIASSPIDPAPAAADSASADKAVAGASTVAESRGAAPETVEVSETPLPPIEEASPTPRQATTTATDEGAEEKGEKPAPLLAESPAQPEAARCPPVCEKCTGDKTNFDQSPSPPVEAPQHDNEARKDEEEKATSAALLRLRLRSARQECELQSIKSCLAAVVGCVHTAMADAQSGASSAVSPSVMNVFEYVVRLCSRTLAAAHDGGAPAVSAVPSSLLREMCGVSLSPALTPLPSPTSSGHRPQRSPRLILHRLRDKPLYLKK